MSLDLSHPEGPDQPPEEVAPAEDVESPTPDAPGPPPPPASPLPPPIVFEDLTLAQALGYLFWWPWRTMGLFWGVLTRDPGVAAPAEEVGPPPDDEDDLDRGGPPPVRQQEHAQTAVEYDGAWRAAGPPDESAPAPTLWAALRGEIRAADRATWTGIGVMALAALLAVQGGQVLYDAATDPVMHATRDSNGAGFWFVLSGALYVAFEMVRGRGWWAARFPRAAQELRARFARNDLLPVWAGTLTLFAGALLLLVAIGEMGVIVSAALLALAAALWLIVVIGAFRAPVPASEVGEPQRVFPLDGSPVPDDTDGGDDAAFVVRSAVRAETPETGQEFARAESWIAAHFSRLMLVPVALVLSALAYGLNVARDTYGDVYDVVFTPWGFFAWVASIALWAAVLAGRVRWGTVPGRVRALLLSDVRWGWLRRLLVDWTFWALLAITALGAYIRLYNLSSTPPEMTSDHIEKLLDALRVHDGYRGVFFPNNGGREGFQMYLVAFIAGPLGVGFSFTALKLATVFEGVITIPVVWWMARQVFGAATDEDRQIGNWTGLALAGLVAVSSWHLMLSRLGLRIVLTPLTAALVIGFLARVLRHNRARDTIALGAVLGAGTYFYQADRMLPVLVVFGVGLGLLGRVRSRRDVLPFLREIAGFAALVGSPLLIYWYVVQVLQQSGYSNPHTLGERLAAFVPLAVMVWFSVAALILRARQERVFRLGAGILAAAVIALAVYIPLYHYSELHSADFWNRTRGRMFGEDVFFRVDPNTGQLEAYDPSLREQADRFWDQRDVFEQNYQDALRMYHWEGDGAWINNAGSRPALQAVSGGLLILGMVMWGVTLARRRDPVVWLIPAATLVMLLPSAMTLAYTIENPSFTRASGTIPPVFLLAALPLGVLGARLARVHAPLTARWTRVPVGRGIALVLLAAVLWGAVGPNWDNFFTDYRLSYAYSWKPYSEIAQPLHDFARSPNGNYGNAFMIAYPHWLDHRILGTMAGDIRWPNGLVTRDDLLSMIGRNHGTPYQYDPAKKMFVMYHPNDEETGVWLQTRFPGGVTELYTYYYEVDRSGYFIEGEFYIYTVWAGFVQ